MSGAVNHLGQNVHGAEAARRERLGPHGRLVEDLVDDYTRAVKDGAVGDYFAKLAAELLDLRAAKGRLADFESATTRIGIAVIKARTALNDLKDEIDNP